MYMSYNWIKLLPEYSLVPPYQTAEAQIAILHSSLLQAGKQLSMLSSHPNTDADKTATL